MKFPVLIILIFSIFSTTHVKSQKWQTNFEETKTQAADQSKYILLSFQGSDWCIPCIKLEKEIWHTEVFNDFAQDELILLKADFPRRKKNALSDALQKHNAQLAETYNPQGVFPLVVILDPDGKVIAETGFKKISAEEYVLHLKELM